MKRTVCERRGCKNEARFRVTYDRGGRQFELALCATHSLWQSYDRRTTNVKREWLNGVATNEEARRLSEFGMFGLDFCETKRIVNRLLKPHGLTLKTHLNYAKWGNQSEVWIESRKGAR